MKQTKLRILSALLAVLMLLGLAACGKAEPSDPNRIKIGSYELFYKGAKIMTDYDGNDAIVVTLDYTNNSKEANSYLWSFVETVKQNGTELTGATIFLSEDSFDTVTDSQFSEVAAGETLEVQLAYVLADLTSEVELQWEELLGTKSGKLTIDPTTLTREEPEAAAQSEDPADVDITGGTATGTAGGPCTAATARMRAWMAWHGTSAAPSTSARTTRVPSLSGTRTTPRQSPWPARTSVCPRPEPVNTAP